MTYCILLIVAVWVVALWPEIKRMLPEGGMTGTEFDAGIDLD